MHCVALAIYFLLFCAECFSCLGLSCLPIKHTQSRTHPSLLQYIVPSLLCFLFSLSGFAFELRLFFFSFFCRSHLCFSKTGTQTFCFQFTTEMAGGKLCVEQTQSAPHQTQNTQSNDDSAIGDKCSVDVSKDGRAHSSK